MALLALAAPTVFAIDPQFKVVTGVVPAAAGTALTGNTGFTVPWVPGLVIQIVAGATAPGVVTLVSPATSVPAPALTMVANADLLFGPIGSQFASPTTGLVQVNVTTVTTASVNAYLMPNATGPTHSPFENNPTITDY
jgi:hypothetical protein